MRILIDMGLSPRWRESFQKHEIEAVHWSEIGDSRATDLEIIDYARVNGFLVFTHDLDFSRLLALTHAAGPSVIQIRSEDILPESIGSFVLSVVLSNQTALNAGALNHTAFRLQDPDSSYQTLAGGGWRHSSMRRPASTDVRK